jgi:hypothetical protein
MEDGRQSGLILSSGVCTVMLLAGKLQGGFPTAVATSSTHNSSHLSNCCGFHHAYSYHIHVQFKNTLLLLHRQYIASMHPMVLLHC